jgi:acetoin utilization protein AcuB
MRVRDYMTTQVITVAPLDPAAHALDLIEAHRIDQLPVVVEGKLVGLLTKKDLRDALQSASEVAGRMRSSLDLGRLTVEMVMTPHVLTVRPDDPIVYAARLMRRERIGCLPVVEGSRLVGIVTRSDLLGALADSVVEDDEVGGVGPCARVA